MASVAASSTIAGRRCRVALAMVGRVSFGAGATVLQKVQYSTVSVGLDGLPKPFRKPIFMAVTAQLAMTLIGLLGAALCHCHSRRGKDSPEAPVDGHGELAADKSARTEDDVETGAGAAAEPPRKGDHTAAPGSYWRKVGLCLLPAFFDLTSAVLMNVALMYMPASVNHMLRASGIVFTALLSVSCLRKKITSFQWCGVAVCCLGVVLAGTSGVTAVKIEELRMMLLATAIALLSQFLAASQAIGEEALIKNLDLPPLETLGWEGLWGVVLVLGIVQPVASCVPGQDNGHLEDLADTLAMLANNPKLLLRQVALLIAIGASACTATFVTTLLNSVHRKILSCCGSIPIWVFGLVAFYCFGQYSGFGEAWTSLSFLELVGFVMIICGQATYGGLFRPPRCLSGGSGDDACASGTGKKAQGDADESCEKVPSQPAPCDAELSTLAPDTASESSFSECPSARDVDLGEASEAEEP